MDRSSRGFLAGDYVRMGGLELSCRNWTTRSAIHFDISRIVHQWPAAALPRPDVGQESAAAVRAPIPPAHTDATPCRLQKCIALLFFLPVDWPRPEKVLEPWPILPGRFQLVTPPPPRRRHRLHSFLHRPALRIGIASIGNMTCLYVTSDRGFAWLRIRRCQRSEPCIGPNPPAAPPSGLAREQSGSLWLGAFPSGPRRRSARLQSLRKDQDDLQECL